MSDKWTIYGIGNEVTLLFAKQVLFVVLICPTLYIGNVIHTQWLIVVYDAVRSTNKIA